MTSLYDDSPDTGALRQGEILEGVREIKFKLGCLPGEIVTGEETTLPVQIQTHNRTIVLSPDCDLEWDYHARKDKNNNDTKLMSHVLLCDLEDEATMRAQRVPSSNIFRIVRQNRDERYHFLRAGKTGSGSKIPDYYIDFKRMFALPAEYVTNESESGSIKRLGVLRPPWNQHLSHRFTFFLGRVGLPDEAQ